jgi:hypothetical protein
MMKRKIAIGLVFCSLIIVIWGCKGKTAAIDKVGVQAAMAGFIDAKLKEQGGRYSIDGIKTEFDYLHDGVKEKGGLFVSCADFKAGDGVYDIDYYVKREGDSYVVVKEVFHKKNGEKVDRVLWQKGE